MDFAQPGKNFFCKLLIAGAFTAYAGMAAAADVKEPFLSTKDHIDKPCLDRLKALHASATNPLSVSQLETFKAFIGSCGWPTALSGGRQAINFAGDLTLWSELDNDYQEQLIDLVSSRMGVDVSPEGYALWNDRIEFEHDGTQQFGALVAVEHGKVVLSPKPAKLSTPRSFRDLNGLPPLEEWLATMQKKVDVGVDIHAPDQMPSLAQAYRPYTQPKLREQLSEMVTADQDARSAAIQPKVANRQELMDKVSRIDAANLPQVKAIFARYGFPTRAMVGLDGVSSAFLLVQHSDKDPAFQAQALKLAEPLLERHELSRQMYALLTDRMLLAQGKKQLYGTQATFVHGKAKPRPLSDPQNVDARRAGMAMETLSEYLKSIAKMYGPSQK
jgi:hypothetical protein